MHTVHSNAEDILPVYCQDIGFLSKIGFGQLITLVNQCFNQSNVHNIKDILVTSFLLKNLVSMLQQPQAPVKVHSPWRNGNAITSTTSITSHICVHACTYTAHDQTSLTVLVFTGVVCTDMCVTIIQLHLKVSQVCKDETGQCQLLSCGEANS